MSNPNPHRDHGYRGGSGGGGNFSYRGRGRGGGRGNYKPRRYWDNDDYYKRDRDYDDRRGRRNRRSRSRTRSRSRSYSRSHSRSRSGSRSFKGSRSHSREGSPRRNEEYQAKNSFTGPSEPTQQYEPYTPQAQKSNAVSSVDLNPTAPQQMYTPQPPQQVTNGQTMTSASDPQILDRREYGLPVGPSYQKQPDIPVAAEPEYYRSKVAAYNPQEEYGGGNQAMYQQQQQQNVTYIPTGLPPAAPVVESKKKEKKDKKKKKRRQRSSSTSSSSSSSSSSESDVDRKSRGKRKSKRSSESSESSEEDRQEKAKRPGSGVTTEQRKALFLQRENYNEKFKLLQNNIDRLISKEYELRQSNADMDLIEENKKLQSELKGRSKAVQIVLEKINDILQDGGPKPTVITDIRPTPPAPPPPPKISHTQPLPPVAAIIQKRPQPLPQVLEPTRKAEIDFYDNGQHWCRLCNVFPESIQDMLDHFHTKEHHAQVEQLGIEEKPWRKRSTLKDTKPGPGAKKLPFKGMQFFSPVQGWYCRICSTWMGDHECAIDHLKNEDHVGNYLNFLDEHPDWEAKWTSDREKARGRSGFPTGTGQQPPSISRLKLEAPVLPSSHGHVPGGIDAEMDDNAKSIRIQMRNMVKVDENRTSAAPFVAKTETPSKVDAAVDEWMGKPQKVKIDIDTQKFAAIVRQKHGHKDIKETSQSKGNEAPALASKSSPSVSATRDRDRESERERSSREVEPARRHNEARRYGVEMSLPSSRDRDRDRYGNRGRRGRSRSRSKSRSRSRDRHRRRTSPKAKARSKSPKDRDRDREADRSRDQKEAKDKEKATPEVKETVKKLPIIGKMPLYKKPVISSATIKDKKKPESEPEIKKSFVPIITLKESKPPVLREESRFGKKKPNTPVGQVMEESNLSVGSSDNSMPGFSVSGFSTLAGDEGSNYGYDSIVTRDVPSLYTHSFQSVAPVKPPEEIVSASTRERESTSTTGSGTTLPDDLQQALDIIYSGPEKPPPPIAFRFGPPNVPPPSNYDYPPSGYNSYGSYQQPPPPIIPSGPPPSYEPYGVNVYEDLDDGPPGETFNMSMPSQPPMLVPPPFIPPQVEKPVEMVKRISIHEIEMPVAPRPTMNADEMEDLRMLGIDVDDIAAAALR